MRRIILTLLTLASTSTMASDKLNLTVNMTTECAIDTIAPIAFGDQNFFGDINALTQTTIVRIDCPFDTPISYSFSGGSGWDPVVRSRFLTLDGAGGTQFRIPYEIRTQTTNNYLVPHSEGTISNYYGTTGRQLTGTILGSSMATLGTFEFRVRGGASGGTFPRATQYPYTPGVYRDRINFELVF